MRIIHSFFICLLGLTACASDIKTVEYAPAPYIPNDAHPAPLVFNGLELLLPPGTVLGYKSSGSIICTPPLTPISRTKLSRAIDRKFLSQTFHDAMESNGYDVAGSIASIDDNTAQRQRAAYSITAKVTSVALDLCEKSVNPLNLFTQSPGTKGQLHTAIEWNIYDPFSRTVILKTRSEGYSHTNQSSAEGLTLLFQDAFEMATQNLSADPALYDLLVMGNAPARGQSAHPDNRDITKDPRPRIFNPHEILIIPPKPLSRTAFKNQKPGPLSTMLGVQKFGHGSGILLTRRGHILTSAHMVGHATRLRITPYAHPTTPLTAEVLRINEQAGVALLKLENPPDWLKTAYIAPIQPDSPAIGSDVFAIGSPQDWQKSHHSLSKGIISAHRNAVRITHGAQKQNYIQADINMYGAKPGSILLDEYGNLLGINTSASAASHANGAHGLNDFLPMTEALNALNIQR